MAVPVRIITAKSAPIVFSDEQAHAIAAALPKGVPKQAVLEVVRSVNNAAVVFNKERERRSRRPPGRERERWAKIVRSIDTLAVQVRQLRKDLLWTDPAPEWPAEFLAELWPRQLYAERRLAAYKSQHSAMRRRQDPDKAFLYSFLLMIWTDIAGQKLKGPSMPSRAKGGTPSGPLFNYFQAATRAILGDDAPKPHTIRDIIRRERKRQKGRSHRLK